jgi:hypothetical protein
MPTHAGPNPALDSNIVFSYDVGDTINSYRGEPTTNLLTYSTNFSAGPWYGYCGNNSNVTPNTTDVIDPFGGFNATKVVRNNQTICDGSTPGWGLIYSSGGTLSANNTYTTSIWARCATGTMTLHFGISDFYGSTVTLTTEWQRFTLTSYYEAPAQTDRVFQFFSTDQNVTYYVCAAQTEPKDHATQYVASGATNGTRSATQGLLPLISNTSLNISTVSFNSNAQIVFDGTDDYINLPTNFQSGYTQATYEFICKSTSLPGAWNYFQLYIQETSTWMALYNVGSGAFFGIDLNNGSGWFDGNGGSTTGAKTTATLTANTYYHIVYSWDGTIVRIYLNGVLQSTTSTLQASNGRQNVTTLGAGDTPRNIGARGGGNYWPGNIDIIKFYNTAISTDQVKQNYNQYKSRFNLS